MWNISDTNNFVHSTNNLFKLSHNISKRSRSISDRENDPEKFIKRISFQIKEMIKNDLPYDTPEDWDDGFSKLGGGQSRRRSSAILSRMTWEQFLEKLNEVIKTYEVK